MLTMSAAGVLDQVRSLESIAQLEAEPGQYAQALAQEVPAASPPAWSLALDHQIGSPLPEPSGIAFDGEQLWLILVNGLFDSHGVALFSMTGELLAQQQIKLGPMSLAGDQLVTVVGGQILYYNF